MARVAFGETVTPEDRAYDGSRFHEVREALFANPYQRVWGAPGTPPLPVCAVTLSSVLEGTLRLGVGSFFRQATERAVDSAADLRWGADRRGFRRLLHPNGICLTGLWEVTEDTPYSGYFAGGSRACSWAGIRRAARRPGVATSARCRSSASSFPLSIPITSSRCARRASSRSRTSAATRPTTSMTPNSKTRTTPRRFGGAPASARCS